jgi:hypothetical protein
MFAAKNGLIVSGLSIQGASFRNRAAIQHA